MKKLIFSLSSLIFFISFSIAQTQTFTVTSTWVCPVGVYSVEVQAWGAGQGGSGVGNLNGGIGGDFAQTNNIAVTPLTSYTVTVGTGGLAGVLGSSAGGNGGNSSFQGDVVTVIAAGGGNSGTSGSITYSGGLGGTTDATYYSGGGGGGGAGSTGNGGTGGVSNYDYGGAGGSGGSGGGGAGGNGSDYSGIYAGTILGGGGGGGSNFYSENAGAGANGQVILTWTVSTPTITIASQNNILCNGGTGSATANSATGATSPYTYAWTPTGGSNLTASNLSAGSYTITVTDANSFTASASVTISQPSAVTANAVVNTNATACANTGSATATPGGGISPYTYSWLPSGGNGVTASNLSAGTYIVSVQDNNGCSATTSIVITQPNALTAIANVISNVLCNGGNTGNLSSTISGGTTPYTYSWTGGVTNSSLSNLSIGTYTLLVTDNSGCTATANATITQPMAISVTHDSVADDGTCNGLAAVTVSGGTSPYTYLWTPGNQTTDTIKGQCARTYCCTITDNNNCSKYTCVTVKSTSGIDDVGSNSIVITVYPNPANTEITFETRNLNQTGYISIFDIAGRKIQEMEIVANKTVLGLGDYGNGVYIYQVSDEAGNVIGRGKFCIEK